MTTIKNQTISSAGVREVLRNNRDWEYTEAFAKGWNDVLDGKPWDYDFCDRAAIHDKLLEKRLMVRISGTCSISCSAPRPTERTSAAPPNTTRGACA